MGTGLLKRRTDLCHDGRAVAVESGRRNRWGRGNCRHLRGQPSLHHSICVNRSRSMRFTSLEDKQHYNP